MTIVAIAKQNQKATQALIPLLGAIILIMVSSAVAADHLVLHILFAVALILFVVAGVQLAVAYRRTARFISRCETSDPATAATPAGPNASNG